MSYFFEKGTGLSRTPREGCSCLGSPRIGDVLGGSKYLSLVITDFR